MLIEGHISCRNPSCTITFISDKNRKIFCGLSCAAKINNTRRTTVWTEKAKQKARENTLSWWANTIDREDIQQKCSLPTCDNIFIKKRKKKFCSPACRVRSRLFNPQYLLKDLDGIREEASAKRRDRMMSVPFDTLGSDHRRLRVIAEQNGCCINCGLSEWCDTPITFEIEHRDGDRTNQIRSNLEARCPNCHSLTDTWRGRNKNKGKVSDTEMIEAIRSTRSLCQALTSLGMAAKGGNYTRAKKLKAELLLQL